MPQSAATISRPLASDVLELLKPITWFAAMWAFMCGLVSAGFTISTTNWPVLVAGVLLAGPLVCGTSQAINDWYDRHVDAINEPNRPIPSGRIPGQWGLYIAIIGSIASLVVSTALGTWGIAAAVFGLVLAWAYSMPPIRLKQNGWFGNAACALCYEGLSWFTGAVVMTGALPDARILALAALYSFGAHGIMTLNDFKSVEGDRAMGVRSLPVQLGVDAAAKLACAVMAIAQVIVISLLVSWGQVNHALIVTALLAAQCALMLKLIADPRGRAPWYGATGVTLYVLGMLVSAFAVRGVIGGGLT
jgi:chlorophyll/bacteriochlorophyll a synthase